MAQNCKYTEQFPSLLRSTLKTDSATEWRMRGEASILHLLKLTVCCFGSLLLNTHTYTHNNPLSPQLLTWQKAQSKQAATHRSSQTSDVLLKSKPGSKYFICSLVLQGTSLPVGDKPCPPTLIKIHPQGGQKEITLWLAASVSPRCLSGSMRHVRLASQSCCLHITWLSLEITPSRWNTHSAL